LQHLREYFGVACTKVAAFEEGVVALQVTHQTARFCNQQTSCGDVPRFKANFKETIIAPRSSVSEIKCGRAGPAQAGSLLHHVAQDIHIGVEMLKIGVRKSGANQAVGQFDALAYTKTTVIDISAAATRGGEQVILGWVIYNGLGQYAIVLQSNGHSVLLKTVQEVGGAIEWVDDPKIFGVASGTALFC